MIIFPAKYRLGEADAIRKDVSSCNTSIIYPDSILFYLVSPILKFYILRCAQFSTNEKCYKILKIDVWPITV